MFLKKWWNVEPSTPAWQGTKNKIPNETHEQKHAKTYRPFISTKGNENSWRNSASDTDLPLGEKKTQALNTYVVVSLKLVTTTRIRHRPFHWGQDKTTSSRC